MLVFVFITAFVAAVAYRLYATKGESNKGTKPSTGGRPLKPKLED